MASRVAWHDPRVGQGRVCVCAVLGGACMPITDSAVGCRSQVIGDQQQLNVAKSIYGFNEPNIPGLCLGAASRVSIITIGQTLYSNIIGAFAPGALAVYANPTDLPTINNLNTLTMYQQQVGWSVLGPLFM